MLSLEIIGILGGLFAFLVYGMVRTSLAKREAGERRRTEEVGPVAAQKGR
ncbi:MAG: hypothetical protein OEV76_02405 [Anaerolineae bacterium]|nr:hypothetical protein [Anaerolineae bacterium]